MTETDQHLRADRGRLRQLLENLIQNAVEHVGEDVTLAVGEIGASMSKMMVLISRQKTVRRSSKRHLSYRGRNGTGLEKHQENNLSTWLENRYHRRDSCRYTVRSHERRGRLIVDTLLYLSTAASATLHTTFTPVPRILTPTAFYLYLCRFVPNVGAIRTHHRLRKRNKNAVVVEEHSNYATLSRVRRDGRIINHG